LLDWQKQQGETVERGDNLIDIETDKVVPEVTAADSGVLKEIRKSGGEDVSSNEVIAVIDTTAEVSGVGEPTKKQAETPSETEQKAPLEGQAKDKRRADQRSINRDQPRSGAQPGGTPDDGREERFSPAVRKLLEENQLEARDIAGSGKDGRITKADVIAYLESEPAAESDQRPSESVGLPSETRAFAPRPERRVAMTRLRKRVAERLLQAQREKRS
jgi:2-oxoglutarate dehydrogenase E2 component (dihydrolipoamide succinyltransferase)